MLVVAGSATGFLVGLTGVGGGALMTPLLLLLFGVAPLSAVGTDLWFAAITKMFATRVHQGQGLIDWQVAKRLWCGSLTSSAATLGWMALYPGAIESAAFLKMAVAGAVIVTASGLLFHKTLHSLGRRLRTTHEKRFKSLQGPLTVACGALLGVLVTLTSVGAGALGAVFLVYLYPLRLTPSRLIATDIVHAIPLAMFAGIGHFAMGNINFALLGNLLVGSVPAVILGAMLSARLPQAFLRWILALVLMVIGAKLWWGAHQ